MHRTRMPRLRVLAVFSLAVSLGFASSQLQAQKDEGGNSFVIDPNRPYVYLKFDHIGKGIQRWESEPTSRHLASTHEQLQTADYY
jgi:hypothetical protein